jgi:alpha-L-arabinofuranosidase
MAKQISKGMFGLFFEDINYGLDGGLHAEMLENRAFEFLEGHGYKDHYYQKGAYLYGWNAYPDDGASKLSVLDIEPLNDINPHYLCLKTTAADAGFTNKAYDGIFMKAKVSSHVSFYAKTMGESLVTVKVMSKDGKELCSSGELSVKGSEWTKYECDLVSEETIREGVFTVVVKEPALICFDQFRMCPEDAVLGLFRKDLAELLKEIRPGFMRFPGGCIIEGNELTNRYQWKKSVGPSEERKSNWNRWAVHGNDDGKKDIGPFPYYNQTLGIGYYEYFLLCEYLQCEPLPVMNVGLACQYQSSELVYSDSPEFGVFVQDALDLIEFANGDESTQWGALRAKMGHPAPFNMKFIGIGNEQWETEKVDFFHRYDAFEKAIHEKYPEIRCCGSAGPDVTSQHYKDAWDHFSPRMKERADYSVAVDEHYYVSDKWMYENVHMYDNYEKHRKVFAGEYACHINGDRKPELRNSFGAALAEAAFMTGLERNADVVLMASYAPLFARLGYAQWHPDLIWFDAEGAYGTPSYYVQKMYARLTGTEVIEADFSAYENDKVYITASKDAEKIYVKVINAGEKDVPVSLADISSKASSKVYLMEGDVDDCNSVAEPEKVALKETNLSVNGEFVSKKNTIAVLVFEA